MAKRSKTSSKWLQEHFADEFVQRAQEEGYRSRASYKLLEINKKDRLLKQGMTVIETKFFEKDPDDSSLCLNWLLS